jgi:hypothetical protein
MRASRSILISSPNHGQRKAGNGSRKPGPDVIQKSRKPIPDFSIEGEGRLCSVYLLRPLTPAAFDWIEEHIPEDAQRLGNAIAVEHRYIGAIAEGILADGLVVA